jgi:hypothetical protein
VSGYSRFNPALTIHRASLSLPILRRASLTLMKTKCFSLAAAVLLLAGCVSQTITMGLDGGGENRIAPTDVINVALANGIAGRAEPVHSFFGSVNEKLLLATGGVWVKVFIGGENAPAKLELVSTKLSENIAGGGFTTRYTYEIDARLLFAGESYPIKVKGSRAAAMMIFSAQRQAVELAVVDAARQAKAIIAEVQK